MVCWVDFVEIFYLLIVYFMDCLGFMVGFEVEKVVMICYGVCVMVVVN